MVTDILQRDIERFNQVVEKFQVAFKEWNPFGQLASEQQAIVQRLRREVDRAEEQLNRTFLAAPAEVRKRYLKEKLLGG